MLRIRVSASTYGCSLRHLRWQPPLPTAAASFTYGCSLYHLRWQPGSPAAAAFITYGCSIATYGYSLYHLRLQARLLSTLPLFEESMEEGTAEDAAADWLLGGHAWIGRRVVRRFKVRSPYHGYLLWLLILVTYFGCALLTTR